MGNFNPQCPCGHWLRRKAQRLQACLFQSTVPLRALTGWQCPTFWQIGKFQSTVPLRALTGTNQVSSHATEFQSTVPLRALTAPSNRHGPLRYFNPQCPCGHWPALLFDLPQNRVISIHSAPAGTDSTWFLNDILSRISIHSAPAGTDERIKQLEYDIKISIHSAPAGTDGINTTCIEIKRISIHSAPAGTDSKTI